jgi:hypothetical protein
LHFNSRACRICVSFPGTNRSKQGAKLPELI